MTDLSPEARSIIEAGRDGDGAGDLERARVRRALMAKIAAGGATLAASSAAAGGSTVGSITVLKILGPIVVLLAGGVGGTMAWRAHRQPVAPAPVAAAPAPVFAPTIVPTVSAPAPAPAPAAEPVRHAPPRHAHVAARAEASTTDRLAEETALLAASNAQLRAGDARRALALLNDYDRRYPTGVLREEVLATRVIAGCQIGLEPDAASRRAADKFLRRHPATPLASRVRSSCAR